MEQQGKEYYDIGRFAEAAQVWQQAADAYGQNEDGKNKNLINKAKALQSLGLYPEACSQLLQVFTSLNLTCEQLINSNQNVRGNFVINTEAKPNSLNKTIGLRLFCEVLQRLGELNMSQKNLEISLLVAEKYPEEKSATLLTLGNLERAKGNENRDRLDYEKIGDFIQNKSNTEALELYNQAFKYYEEAAHQAPIITQIQSELNQLSLIVEMKECWAEQITKSKKSNWTEFWTLD